MKRSLLRGEKKLVLLCSALMLGLGGIGMMRARLDAEPDWAIPAAKPTPQPNGYDLYVAAATAVIRANPPVDAVVDINRITDPKVIATQYSLARHTAWVKQNAAVWKLFEQARAAHSLYAPDRSGLTGQWVGYRKAGKLRELARCKIIAANTAKMRGDWNDASNDGLDIIEFGGDVARGAPSIGFLVSLAIEAIGENSFCDTPAHLNAKEARYATHRLEKLLKARVSLADIMREDKWEGLCQLRCIMQTAGWRRPSTWGLVTPRQEIVQDRFLSKKQVVNSYTHILDWYIATANQPYSASRRVPEADNFISRAVAPSTFARYKFGAVRSETELKLLLLRFALRAYRVEQGAYPNMLGELAPAYVTQIPSDPFGNGKSICYRKKGDSYLLWSIGPDGKDDNGKPSPPRGIRKIATILPENIGDAIAIPEWK